MAWALGTGRWALGVGRLTLGDDYIIFVFIGTFLPFWY